GTQWARERWWAGEGHKESRNPIMKSTPRSAFEAAGGPRGVLPTPAGPGGARILAVLALASLAIPLACIPLGWTAVIVAASLAGALALILGLSALLLRFGGRRGDTKPLSEYQQADFLAHWTYDPVEWQQFVEHERRRNRGGWLGVASAV